VEALIAEDGKLSHSYGGRSIFGWEKAIGEVVSVNSKR